MSDTVLREDVGLDSQKMGDFYEFFFKRMNKDINILIFHHTIYHCFRYKEKL